VRFADQWGRCTSGTIVLRVSLIKMVPPTVLRRKGAPAEEESTSAGAPLRHVPGGGSWQLPQVRWMQRPCLAVLCQSGKGRGALTARIAFETI
jgi:hypothetical protein